MPELPEAETHARALGRAVKGRRIAKVVLGGRTSWFVFSDEHDNMNNWFAIENGTALRGYPRRVKSPAAFEWPNEDVQSVEAELFRAHADFLMENREKIFADSRMVLAPVNVMSGAAYVGA